MSEKYKVIDSTVPTIRDFKKYTSKKLIEAIQEHPESRREKYNNETLENSDVEYDNFIKTLHPFLQKHIEYMDFIRKDCSANSDGKLYVKLYGGKITLGKMNAAQRPGIHTEVLVLNELIKGKSISSVADIRTLDIKIVIRWEVKKNKIKHMVTCPHCFYITEGVFFPNNK
jgi:hypothetical protein